MQDIFADISANLTDFLIYAATILAALIGLFKCVLPVRRAAHRLRRAVRLLETSANDSIQSACASRFSTRPPYMVKALFLYALRTYSEHSAARAIVPQ